MKNKKILTTIFYTLIGLDAALGLFIIYDYLLTRTSSITTIISNTQNNQFYFWFYIISTVIAFILFGIDSSLTVYAFRQTNNMNGKEQSGTFLGALSGAFAASCPFCAGILLSLVGISGGLASFPFKGLELKTLSIVFLAAPIWFLTRRVKDPNCDGKCPIPQDPSYKKRDKLLLISLSTLFVALVILTSFLLKKEPIFSRLVSSTQTTTLIGAENICKVVNL